MHMHACACVRAHTRSRGGAGLRGERSVVCGSLETLYASLVQAMLITFPLTHICQCAHTCINASHINTMCQHLPGSPLHHLFAPVAAAEQQSVRLCVCVVYA